MSTQNLGDLAAELRLADRKALTFDVVGALIDFETGLIEAVRRIAGDAAAPLDDAAILAAAGSAESRAVDAPVYREALEALWDAMAGELGLPRTPAAAAAFAASPADWPAFPDSVDALKRLKKRYRLVAITNVDPETLALFSKTLKKPFHDAVTAVDAGARKPDPRAFAFALGRLSAKKIGREAVLHVAQSQHHDLRPARAAGLDTVWLERRQGKIGPGATPFATPIAPRWRIDRLWPLVAAVESAFGAPAPDEPAWAPRRAAAGRSVSPRGAGSEAESEAGASGGPLTGASAGSSIDSSTDSSASSSAAAAASPADKGAGRAAANGAVPTDLARLTIVGAREGLRAKKFSARELTEACLSAIEAADRLNAVVWKTPEKARAMADAADARLASEGAAAPALCGIPLGIKDLFCTEGVESQAASAILARFKPPYESTVTRQLWDRGAVMLGKLNMDEFAMGSSNETSCYGPAVNPWRGAGGNADLTPGGSSGGSASAVAADLCLAATGTDTGGSIRQPAAFTGIVGLKPTYGRCSRWGGVAFASSLDQAGPMTKTVRDAAIMLEAMAGEDPKDSTSAPIAVPDFEAACVGDLRGRVIGIPAEYRLDGAPEEIARLWDQGADWLRDAGAEIREISLPHTKYALPAYYIIAPAEASSNLARYDGVKYGLRAEPAPGDGVAEMYEKTRAEGFGPEVRRRVLIGSYVLSAGYYDAYYLRAQKVRTLIKRDFDQAFEAGVDAILTPSPPSAAFAIGDPAMEDPVKMYLNDVFTVTVNLAGLPGISTPAGLDARGLPLGLQLIGKPFGEADLLNAATALERAAGFSAKPDRWW